MSLIPLWIALGLYDKESSKKLKVKPSLEKARKAFMFFVVAALFLFVVVAIISWGE